MAQRKTTTKKGGRPKKARSQRLGVQVALRLKEDLVEKIVAKTRELERDHPGVSWTRGQVIRHILYEALADY